MLECSKEFNALDDMSVFRSDSGDLDNNLKTSNATLPLPMIATRVIFCNSELKFLDSGDPLIQPMKRSEVIHSSLPGILRDLGREAPVH